MSKHQLARLIENDAGRADAVTRIKELDSELDQIKGSLELNPSSEETSKLVIHRAEVNKERESVEKAIKLYDDDKSSASNEQQRQPPPAEPAPQQTQGDNNMTEANQPSNKRGWIRIGAIVLGILLVGALIGSQLTVTFNSDKLESAWDNTVAAVQDLAGVITIEPREDSSTTGNPNPDRTEPDLGEYSPPSGSEQRWICDEDTYAGEAPDGNPTYGSCVDP